MAGELGWPQDTPKIPWETLFSVVHWLFVEICLPGCWAQRRDEALAVRQAQNRSQSVEISLKPFDSPVKLISALFILTAISFGINPKNKQLGLKNKEISLFLNLALQYGALDILWILSQNDILIGINVNFHIFLSVECEFRFHHSFGFH